MTRPPSTNGLGLARHALVTGGASGIGLGVVRAFVARGLVVSVADVDEHALSALPSDLAGRVEGLALDVRDRAGWAQAKIEAERRFGPVDILVNNAGVGPDGRELAEMDPAVFDKTLAVDVTGVFNGVSSFAADMKARSAGHIVNTASIVGLTSGPPGMGAYILAKAGVIALSEVLRQELEPFGVGVSVLCPGPVASNLQATTRKQAGGAMSSPALERMTAERVGELVLEAIASNSAYIITHPEYAQAFETRVAGIRQAFAPGDRRSPANPTRTEI